MVKDEKTKPIYYDLNHTHELSVYAIINYGGENVKEQLSGKHRDKTAKARRYNVPQLRRECRDMERRD
jgi:hypothetical protein